MKKIITSFVIGLIIGIAGSVLAAKPAKQTRTSRDVKRGSGLERSIQEFQKRDVIRNSRKGDFGSSENITKSQLTDILYKYDQSLINYEDSLVGYMADILCNKYSANDFNGQVRIKYTTLCNRRNAP